MDCDHGYKFVLLGEKTLKLIICKTRSGLQKDNSLKTCVLKENIIVCIYICIYIHIYIYNHIFPPYSPIDEHGLFPYLEFCK